MALSTNATLAEIVNRFPSLTRELERFGLDYCCGGKRRLDVACQQQGLDTAAVLMALERQLVAAEPPAWMALAPPELVDHIEATHHRFLKAELPRLSELAAKVCRVHGERHPELKRVAELLGELRSDLEPHLRKEEQQLFPMIRASDPASRGSIGAQIADLEREHTRVGGLLEQLRSLTGSYQAPPDTCASTRALMAGLAELEADLHLHVHKENNHLFPAVTAV